MNAEFQLETTTALVDKKAAVNDSINVVFESSFNDLTFSMGNREGIRRVKTRANGSQSFRSGSKTQQTAG